MVELLSKTRKVIQRITFFLCFGGMFLLLPMMLVTTWDVIGRAFWAKPIIGALEICSFMLGTFILLAAAYTHQVKGHVRVMMFVSRLPQGLQLIFGAITTSLSLFIIAILAWQGLVIGIEEVTVTDMLRIPEWPFRLLVAVAGLFLFLELLIDLVDIVEKMLRR
jgi:TRAP-type C4-dicarboxylate transport system permease small subunit